MRTFIAQIVQGELASDRRGSRDEGRYLVEVDGEDDIRAGGTSALAGGIVAGEGVDDQVDGRRGTVGGVRISLRIVGMKIGMRGLTRYSRAPCRRK